MIEQLESVVREQMAEWDIPGISLAIWNRGEQEEGAWGAASIATGQQVIDQTLFRIGSISKIFTTTLIMTFVDDGKLDLDTPVIHWIPDLPLCDRDARQSITLRHLLTHMAGFYGDRFDDHGRGDDALERKVAALGDLAQQTKPGEVWTYCNAGFDLAGRVCEIVGDDAFENLMRKRVFDPLQLDTITYFPDEAIRHPVAVGHERDRDRGRNLISDPWPLPRCSNPAGGISATPDHLLRFARMHMNDGELDGVRVISAKSAREMRSLQTKAEPHRTWGLGWQRTVAGGVDVIGHTGSTNGFCAGLVTVPEHHFAIAILTNHDDGAAAHPKISRTAMDAFLGLRYDEPAFIDLPTAALEALAGVYKHELATTTLTPVANGLAATVQRTNPFDDKEVEGIPYTLRPTAERVFVAEGKSQNGSYADFILNDDGSVRFYRFGGRLGYPA